jgi:hypothetical protein
VDALVSHPVSRFMDVFVAVENLRDTEYEVGRTPTRTVAGPRLVRGGLRVRLRAQS